MRVTLLLLFIFSLHLKPTLLHAQNGYGEFNQDIKSENKKRTLKKARRNSEDASYATAIQRYRMLLIQDPDNVTYNKELGMTYFDSPYQKVMAIPYLEKAIEKGKPEENGELYYPLAISYRMKGEYDKAKTALGLYLNQLKAFGSYLSKEDEKALINEIDREIEICNNAQTFSSIPPLSFVKDSITYTPVVTKFPSPVNSIYDEYSAVYINHDSTIILTARRKGSKGEKVNWDGKYFEDILITDKTGSGWSEPRSIGDHINSSGHEAVSSTSNDGKKLYIYKTKKNGSMLVVNKEAGNKWSKPEKLKGNINSKAWETSLGVTLYDSVVYYVSDRKGGHGGRDIYISRKNAKGEWQTGVNLGPVINTAYEEDAPFLSSDGKHLYFASTGHNTMGGFDLFRSEWKDNQWSNPENLGSPINTENNDIYLVLTDGETKGMVSSQRISNDTLNDMNLYEISFDCKTIAQATLRGTLAKKEDGSALKGKIFLTEKSSGKKDSISTNENGTFVVKIEPSKTYMMAIAAEGFIDDTTEIFFPKQCKAYDLYQLMKVGNKKEGNRYTSQQIELQNAFFDIRHKSGSKGGKEVEAEYRKFLETSKDLEKIEGYTYVLLDKPLKEGDVIPKTEISFVNIHFDYDKSDLKSDAKETLDKVADFMKKNTDAIVELRGFADSVGTEAYNTKLSERRAKSAQNYLASKGIKKSRLQTTGFGETQPLNDNGTEDSRQLNRRVEFKVYPTGKDEKAGTKDSH